MSDKYPEPPADFGNDEISKALKPKAASSLAASNGSALVWSSYLPKIHGYYWTRYHGQKCAIAELTGNYGNLKAMFYGERVPIRKLPKDWGWQWAGPLPEPQEPND